VDRVRHHQLWTDIPPEVRVEVGGLIMLNNIYVSMIAFAFGVVFGLPVIYVLITNGISLGGLFGLTQAYGVSGGLFDFVIGHGILELSIVIAQGAGGLMMGWALISPGNRKRTDALVIATRRAFTLLLGLAPLLATAGHELFGRCPLVSARRGGHGGISGVERRGIGHRNDKDQVTRRQAQAVGDQLFRGFGVLKVS